MKPPPQGREAAPPEYHKLHDEAVAPLYNNSIRVVCRCVALQLFAAIILNVNPLVASATSARDIASQCGALKDGDFSNLQDAPTQILEANLIEESATAPVFCQARGYVAPQVGFEIRLPALNWNKKFIAIGCGGLCGRLWSEIGVCDAPLRRGYACVVSDMGHKGTDFSGIWAYNNLQGEMDFAYRATRVSAIAGKAIAKYYYRSAPERSYFMGCSQGGRQGLVAAQRFPWDFDGIIAGAPPVDMTALTMYFAWAINLARQDGTASALTPSAIELLHNAAVSRCDLDDGVKDGIIGNPPACNFDPSELVCKAHATTSDRCLDEAQAQATKRIYAGVTTSSGEKLHSGAAVGSELNWISSFNGWLPQLATDVFRYISFLPDAGPTWKLADFDFDRDYRRLGLMESLYSASNPDLRKFKQAGGKLIVYSGWNDELAVPGPIIDYYETVEKTIGGRKATQEFFRLFMFPGMNHCAGGVGADAADLLGHLEAWVERGQEPDSILSGHLTNPGTAVSYPYRQFPTDLSNVSFTRPVYPYPLRAVYKGRGDPNRAESFRPKGK